MRLLLLVLGFILLGCGSVTEPHSTPPTDGPLRLTSFDGNAITYIDRGDGPIIVLLHGLTSSAASNFERAGIIRALTREGFRVIAPDLRGHGASSVADTDANWPKDAMARDLAALVDHVGERPAAVVGYSMGALVALRWQVIDGPSDVMVLSGMGELTAVIGDRKRHDGLEALIRSVAAGATGPMQRRVRVLLAASNSDAASVAGSLRRRMQVSAADLSAMDMPVLVLNGDEDFDNGDGAPLAELFPDATFVTVPGDHLSTPQSAAYRDALVTWLSDTVGR